MMKKRNVLLGDSSFVAPFSSNGLWVSDANGKSVGEFRSKEVAKAMAQMLNEVTMAVEKATRLN